MWASTDGTREWPQANFINGPRSGSMIDLDDNGDLVFAPAPTLPTITIRPIFHERNRGKGGGLQTAFAAISGDVLVIQDGDLEYDPADWSPMYDLIAVRQVADVVFGSRFHGRPHRSHIHANRGTMKGGGSEPSLSTPKAMLRTRAAHARFVPDWFREPARNVPNLRAPEFRHQAR